MKDYRIMTGLACYCSTSAWFRPYSAIGRTKKLRLSSPKTIVTTESTATKSRTSQSFIGFSCTTKVATANGAAAATHYHSTATTMTPSADDNKQRFMLWDSLSQSLKGIPLHHYDYDGGGDDDDENPTIADTNKTSACTATTTSKRMKKKKKKEKRGLAWYTCGPTTYADTHLGHARTYVWLDMIRRVLEDFASITGEPSPIFVMNITDIDDKILAAAASAAAAAASSSAGSSSAAINSKSSLLSSSLAMQISRKAERKFFKDMDRLNCLRPHVTTRVTEYVESDIIPYVERLLQNDMAYHIKNADADADVESGVYFDVRAFESKIETSSYYGKLSGNNNNDNYNSRNTTNDNHDDEAEVRKDIKNDDSVEEEDSSSTDTYTPRTQKRDARDFALWKLQKDDEQVFWSSPWGNGRPGWHIECSAMIEAVQNQFQETHKFMVHAGGIDLKFPHHNNEIAQAEAYHYSSSVGTCCSSSSSRGTSSDGITEAFAEGEEWIQHWVHMGHLMVKETKMSKSLNNFLTVDELWVDCENDDQDDDLISKTTTPTTSSSWPPAGSNSRLSSPADDFRWWCLTGGWYGQRQEYSRSKVLIARQKRERILRFLLDGEQWMMEHYQQQNSNHGAGVDDYHSFSCSDKSKRWTRDDHALFIQINKAATDAYRALLDNMKGSIYASRLLQIAEAGNAYIRKHPAIPSSSSSNLEPIKEALKKVRKLLALVGFSDLTVNAGLDIHTIPSPNDNGGGREANNNAGSATTNYVVGGEKAILDELVQFRTLVRRAALEDIKNKKGSDNVKAIMKACDEIRDNLPEMGVEVMDTKNNEGGGAQWRFCVPKERRKK